MDFSYPQLFFWLAWWILWIDWFHNHCKWVFFLCGESIIGCLFLFFEKWYNQCINLEHFRFFSINFNCVISSSPAHLKHISKKNLFDLQWIYLLNRRVKRKKTSEMRALICFDKFRIQLEFLEIIANCFTRRKKTDDLNRNDAAFAVISVCMSARVLFFVTLPNI